MSSRLLIRDEIEGEESVILNVVHKAFRKESTARFLRRVRKEVPVDFSLVALKNGRIIANVLFAQLPVRMDGRAVKASYLACASVLPSSQRQKIGARLIQAGLTRLKESGTEAVFVLGHPWYYPKFGFSPMRTRNICCIFSGKGKAFMALELVPGSLRGISGEADFHPLYSE